LIVTPVNGGLKISRRGMQKYMPQI